MYFLDSITVYHDDTCQTFSSEEIGDIAHSDTRIIETDQGLEIELTTLELGSGTKYTTSIRSNLLKAKAQVRLKKLELKFAVKSFKIFEQGFQSWSPVIVSESTDTHSERESAPEFIKATYYGDVDSLGKVGTSDQFVIARGENDVLLGWLDGKSHIGTFTYTSEFISAVAHLDDTLLVAGDKRVLDPLFVTGQDAGASYSEFATLWGEQAKARTNAKSQIGWCSWYQYFTAVTPQIIEDAAKVCGEHNIDLVQVDDGFQNHVGDWLNPREDWSGKHPQMGQTILKHTKVAGIWTAPFLFDETSELFKTHPEWAVRDLSTDEPLKAIFNPLSWGGWAYALDTTNDNVLNYIESTFAQLKQAGYTYFKIDFCFAAAMKGVRNVETLTRAEALVKGIEAVRKGIGEDSFLLGCGCPFGPAVGLVDAMRVSADTAPFWDERASFFGFSETSPSQKNAIVSSLLRAPLHRRLWINDPDCLMLRQKDTMLTEHERNMALGTTLGTGNFTVLSDNFDLYTSQEWETIDLIKSLSNLDTQIDIEDPFAKDLRLDSTEATLLINPFNDAESESPILDKPAVLQSQSKETYVTLAPHKLGNNTNLEITQTWK